MLRLMCIAPLLLLAACVKPEPESILLDPGTDACHAAQYQSLIGQKAGVLGKTALPAGTRILKPNMAVTADYRADRLNVEIGRNGTVTKVSCF
ncbi:I78 family peptidase inhibitor [Paracoccus aminophilus]|uniref:Peptidase inhibitor I78 family protein n=1 Tax=Paracoccus aminophilus JCM 7686 TaxID=1367847 RepID=S5XJU3_PARAH|nr:I78 family peptidase inhibitor [Paracoccus aminophilus]AGT07459.1 hypothetical protein JCM7686_0350 [Paracoccus aminophilus JCM 7686]